MKEELEKINEDLVLAQEELIAKIQENEMVNIKIFEMEREFQDKEKTFETRINELQKKIHQLDQDITEKENECQKLQADLQAAVEKNEMQETNFIKMEQKYNEDVTKWGKLCERIGSRMEENQYVYQSKFPIDPFSRDQSFNQSGVLFREMQQTVQGMRGKQFNASKKNLTISEDCKKFNDLNVIKADYKTHQRQKEIINVIADFSA